MDDRQRRITVAAVIQAAPGIIAASILRHHAKETRAHADLYETLVGPRGRHEAEVAAYRLERRADELEAEAHHEAERAARVAAIIEGWAT